jgi:S1-C subfamily serine protease
VFARPGFFRRIPTPCAPSRCASGRSCASAQGLRPFGFALTLIVAGASGAEQVPRSRAEVALFAPVVRAAAPAVVAIYAQKQQRRSAANPFSSDPFFRFFFPEFDGGPVPNDVPENSLGSGVIVDAQGLIVTNHHVIEDADEIMVVLSDRDPAAGPAARLHLRRGDLIRTVPEEPIETVAQLKTILRERSLPWRLEVERAGQRLAVVIGG